MMRCGRRLHNASLEPSTETASSFFTGGCFFVHRETLIASELGRLPFGRATLSASVFYSAVFAVASPGGGSSPECPATLGGLCRVGICWYTVLRLDIGQSRYACSL